MEEVGHRVLDQMGCQRFNSPRIGSYWEPCGVAPRGVDAEAYNGRTGTDHISIYTSLTNEKTDEKTFRELVNASIYILRQRQESWIPSEEDINRYWQLYLDGLDYGTPFQLAQLM